MNQLDRLATATRFFGLSAVTGLVLISPDYQLLFPIVVLTLVTAGSAHLTATSPIRPTAVVTAEAVVTGLVIGTAMPDGVALMPYLAALCLVAGLVGGLRAVVLVLVSELATMALVLLGLSVPSQGDGFVIGLAPWIMTGVGLGMLGTWLQSLGAFGKSSLDPSYAAAYRLVTQLRTVAKRLTYGLDSTLIAREVCTEVSNETGAGDVSAFIRIEGDVVIPVAYHGHGAAELPTPSDKAFGPCWIEQVPVCVKHETGLLAGLPLRAGSRLVGVVVARVAEGLSGEKLESLSTQLEASALRLDTALAFDHVRSIATSEERHRLAREIHDGIAQEMVGLGYAVDSLVADADSDVQRAALLDLRGELTRIISELRISIFDLRSDVIGQTGLGQALSDYLRQVGSRSNMTVHLTLDEAAARLRPEVEAELLRIVQEATTNVRKHSESRNIWVTCRVSPPVAEIEVRDDGSGLGEQRDDAYGLRIMHERAERIGATLEVKSPPDGRASGTVVRVTMPSPNAPRTQENGRPNVTRS